MTSIFKFAVLISALILTGAIAHFSAPLFERPGWVAYDWLQRKLPLRATGDVAIVYVDQASINAIFSESGFSWPWPRHYYGAVGRVAAALGAKSVSYDIIFESPSSYGVDDDQAFNEELRRAPLTLVFPAPNAERTVSKPTERIVSGLERLVLGAVVLPAESDGVFRRVPGAIEGPEGSWYAPLGLAATEKPGREDVHWIHYYQDGAIPAVPFYNIVKAFNDVEEGRPVPEELKRLAGRHWFVGYRAPGLLDYKPTPVNPHAAGVEVHASLLANRLSGGGLRPAKPQTTVFAAFGIAALLLAFIIGAKRPTPALAGVLAIGLGASVAASVQQWLDGVWLNPVPLLVGDLLFGIGLLSWRFQTEWKERERLARSVESSMSREMVQLIRTGRLGLSRFGERREITILFSDLSGFTTIAEKMDAAELVSLLNVYLDQVVELIFKHEGYVDKFIGDAVMALWGAPVNGQTNHAKLAFEAAIAFESAVQRFNQLAMREFKIEKPVFTARVGLHTGSCIVGNIGSKDRHNYTAIGDSVNLASRLEALGKKYDCYLLISEDAVRAAGAEGRPGLVEVDTVSVKGRSAPTRIFTFVAPDQSQAIENYKLGLASYRRGEWPLALKYFNLAQVVPSAQVMAGRCDDALKNGAPEAWQNGVWVHDSK
ncbi:MAG TPA: adenylate/guanylate cyclase domain-containing protein [Bdellovibrionales bacterium]|nr:adenylate/guanylate cyclase domain-containing protein [Bdellovibrionales bacterium]